MPLCSATRCWERTSHFKYLAHRNRRFHLERLEDRVMLHGGEHDGEWEGVTASGGALSFEIEDHFFSSFLRPLHISTPGAGGDCALSNAVYTGLTSLGENHHVDFTQGATGGNPTYTFEGLIYGGEWAEGTLTLFRGGQACHEEYWTARRVSPMPPATVTVDVSSESVSEGGHSDIRAEATFPWALSRSIDLDFSGSSAAIGEDFVLSPSEDVHVPARETAGTTRVSILDDGDYDPGEVVQIAIAGVGNGEGVSPGGLSIAIIDNDPPPMPEIGVAPATHDFGRLAVDGGAATTTFTVANTGSADLHITTPVLVAGPNAGDFDVTEQPAGQVAPGGNTQLQVAFAPVGVGSRNAWIDIANNDGDENPTRVTLVGAGVNLRGDYDKDLDVDAADYAVWKTAFGQAVAAGAGADGNSDGRVDVSDYVVWRDNLGATAAGSAINAAPVRRDGAKESVSATPKQPTASALAVREALLSNAVWRADVQRRALAAVDVILQSGLHRGPYAARLMLVAGVSANSARPYQRAEWVAEASDRALEVLTESDRGDEVGWDWAAWPPLPSLTPALRGAWE